MTKLKLKPLGTKLSGKITLNGPLLKPTSGQVMIATLLEGVSRRADPNPAGRITGHLPKGTVIEIVDQIEDGDYLYGKISDHAFFVIRLGDRTYATIDVKKVRRKDNATPQSSMFDQ